MNKNFPHVLVLSNNCFSKSDSNGRTLGNFFQGWPNECLAQFYIQNARPDFEACNNYYRVTDKQALQSLLGKKPNGCIIKPPIEISGNDKCMTTPMNKRRKKNALSMLLRNVIWDIGFWKTKEYKQWLENFAPQLVLLQAGDCAFLIKLSLEIAKKYNVPFIIYNSEGYYFKNYDYFRASGLAHLLYPLFYNQFRKQFKIAQKYVKYNIYLCDTLREEYDKAFGSPSITLYTSTDIKPCFLVKENAVFCTSYLGNLGVGRHTSLIEVANTLQAISTDLFLDVYGKIPNTTVQNALNSCKGIRYRGLIPYHQVIDVMQQSDLLIHVESFDTFYREDLKFAFSTKIADSLGCGTCFLLYAPDDIACTKYLIKNEGAYVATSIEELKSILDLIVNANEKDRYIENACSLVEKNHNIIKNSKQFQNILLQAHFENNREKLC